MMRQFVREQFEIIVNHKCDGLVLHAAAPFELGVAVFFLLERINAEQRIEQLHLRLDNRQFVLRLRQVFRKHVIHQQGAVGALRNVIGEYCIVRDGHTQQISSGGIPGAPVRGRLAIRSRFRHQYAVARRMVACRRGDEDVAGVDLIVQVLITGKPIPGAIRLREGPKNRNIGVFVCNKGAESGITRHTLVVNLDGISNADGQVLRKMQGKQVRACVVEGDILPVPAHLVHGERSSHIQRPTIERAQWIEVVQDLSGDVPHGRVHRPAKATVGDIGLIVAAGAIGDGEGVMDMAGAAGLLLLFEQLGPIGFGLGEGQGEGPEKKGDGENLFHRKKIERYLASYGAFRWEWRGGVGILQGNGKR
jgi:hypothetical protein